MTETLRQILHAEPFAAVRAFDDLVRFHVWQRRIGVAEPADDAARQALARGRGIAVVGPPGSGKTSTLAAAALDPDGIGHRHVPLPLSVMGGDLLSRVSDPRYLAERLVRAIAQGQDDAEHLVDDAASTGTATRGADTWTTQLGAGSTKIGRELRQRVEAVDFERSPTEVLDAARAALDLAAENGLRLVALLEDADGLLRLPGHSALERHDIANAFFMDGLAPLIRELSIPVLIAVQPEYRELEGFRVVADLLDGAVTLPTPGQFSDEGLELLLGESLRTAGIERQLSDVFGADALVMLREHRFELRTIRQLLQVCDRSIAHAQTQQRSSVEADDVRYALTQE
jgi:hypothetical protein